MQVSQQRTFVSIISEQIININFVPTAILTDRLIL